VHAKFVRLNTPFQEKDLAEMFKNMPTTALHVLLSIHQYTKKIKNSLQSSWMCM